MLNLKIATQSWHGLDLQQGGDAFKVAGDYIMSTDNADALLVHGLATPLSGRFHGYRLPHAWIEIPTQFPDTSLKQMMEQYEERGQPVPDLTNTVIDNSNGRHLELIVPVFYGMINVTHEKKYTKEQALSLMGEHETYGPWDKNINIPGYVEWVPRRKR